MNFYYCRFAASMEKQRTGLISQMNFYYCRLITEILQKFTTNKPNEFLLL